MATHVFPKGLCVAGSACKFPNLWLRPRDKCPDCKEIVHPLCGIINEEGDMYRCLTCAESCSDKTSDGATRVTAYESEENGDLKEASNIGKDVTATKITVFYQDKICRLFTCSLIAVKHLTFIVNFMEWCVREGKCLTGLKK